eukprot:CAMPEP_0177393706 /NCGR_PEP_ID=MMETSP0368-20130122/55111_1 /TAXON_ID=447022 ORGANISM="Scrippsiella hangoei-like, Strain SHHI-4" /NCGR_SAMPLE_ID=MMETSP0368 /ASSEMBLY_ACC=CAM_ASM_000363 /LENGTH=33 /DNA_ID= /DNA_START= /DNA_END= /DNA_ORIENTATION=
MVASCRPPGSPRRHGDRRLHWAILHNQRSPVES